MFAAVYKNGKGWEEWITYNYHTFYYAKPIIISSSDYVAGDEFKIQLNIFFVNSPVREYTL